MQIDIRTYRDSDLAFFRAMFYESLFVPPGMDPFPLDIIDRDHLAKYHEQWGRATDSCHIAQIDGEAVGAVWTRYFTSENPGYAYVADDIPELGIALLPNWTGRGIGTRLLQHHLHYLKENGCHAISLSADIRNPAVRLYRRLGFEEVSREGESVVMMTSFSRIKKKS